jgi:protein tyrosine phosphatase (PTP) superfamily phosphohydrolase (DUF442 family)
MTSGAERTSMPNPIEALAGVTNVTAPLPKLITAGQPSAAHFEALSRSGVELVIDIRDPREPRPFDERALVQGLGMEYWNVPVTADTLTDETLDDLLRLIRDNADRSTVLHCASANRVWGPLLPYLVNDQGMTEEAAAQLAMRGGLRGAEILEWGLDYARRHRPER